LKNLKPAKPGEVRNPSGKNRNRPYTDAYEGLANALLPEFLRVQLNNETRARARNKKLPDLFPEGITWAEASALRQHVSAIVDGNVAAAVEIRESVEGRATTRMEFVSQNDKLEALLDAFRAVAAMPPAIVEEQTIVVMEGMSPALPSSDNDSR
jgi:hypothetical protein